MESKLILDWTWNRIYFSKIGIISSKLNKIDYQN